MLRHVSLYLAAGRVHVWCRPWDSGRRLAAAGGGVGVSAGALGDVEARELFGDCGVDAYSVHQVLHCDAASVIQRVLVRNTRTFKGNFMELR